MNKKIIATAFVCALLLSSGSALAQDLNANLGIKADLGVPPKRDDMGQRRDMKAGVTVDTKLDGKVGASKDVKLNLGAYMGYKQKALFSVGKISATAEIMTTFGKKLESRIAAAKAAGENVETETALYVQYEAKVAEAKAHATTAATLIGKASTDTKENATSEANKKIAVEARAEVKASIAALKDARAIAGKIVVELKANKQ